MTNKKNTSSCDNSNCDKTQIVTKPKLSLKSKCDQTQIVTKLEKTQIVTILFSNCDKDWAMTSLNLLEEKILI